jgi:hypothetical protein
MPAGGRSRDEELHLWTFDEHQQVVRMRHYVDTAKHIAALLARIRLRKSARSAPFIAVRVD